MHASEQAAVPARPECVQINLFGAA